MTRLGRRQRRGLREDAEPVLPSPATGGGGDAHRGGPNTQTGVAEDLVVSPRESPVSGSRLRLYVLLGAVGLLLLFVGLHLSGVVGPAVK